MMRRENTELRVGFVTTSELGGITPDDALIAEALAELGIHVEPVVWEDGPPRKQLQSIVLRSPWNYHLYPDDFLRWVEDASKSAIVCNAPSIVRWNSHKGYLLELEDAGIAIAPTVLCKKNEDCNLRDVMKAREWREVIVKPAISASSFMTSIVGASAYDVHRGTKLEDRVIEDGQHLLDKILETRDALVQPFMPEIFDRGERCLIFIAGRFSHAVQKAPFTNAPGGGRPVEAEPEEIDIGRRALAVLDETPLYARVDLLRGSDGVDRLMELELIDPELYMRFDSAAPARFATALQRLS